MLFFLHSLIFLDGFGSDGYGILGRVRGLNAGRRGCDRPPCLATGHTQRNRAAGQQRENDRLNDFVDLFIFHMAHIF